MTISILKYRYLPVCQFVEPLVNSEKLVSLLLGFRLSTQLEAKNASKTQCKLLLFSGRFQSARDFRRKKMFLVNVARLSHANKYKFKVNLKLEIFKSRFFEKKNKFASNPGLLRILKRFGFVKIRHCSMFEIQLQQSAVFQILDNIESSIEKCHVQKLRFESEKPKV